MADVFPPPPPPPLPWEDPSYPRLEALYETTKLFLLRPREAASRMSQTGPLSKPILFAVLLGWVAIIATQVYQWAFRETLASLLPALYHRQELAFSKLATVATVVFAPVWILVGLALVTLVVHLFLLLFGGASGGVETTLRTLAYTHATNVFQVIPLLGGLVGLVWWLVVSIVALAVAHRTSVGKAAAAVLTPVGLCCLCVLAVALFMGAALLAALRGM